jgi:hypothetical protein
MRQRADLSWNAAIGQRPRNVRLIGVRLGALIRLELISSKINALSAKTGAHLELRADCRAIGLAVRVTAL